MNFIDFKHKTCKTWFFNAKLCISNVKNVVSIKNSLWIKKFMKVWKYWWNLCDRDMLLRVISDKRHRYPSHCYYKSRSISRKEFRTLSSPRCDYWRSTHVGTAKSKQKQEQPTIIGEEAKTLVTIIVCPL